MDALITDENVNGIIEGLENELRSVIQEQGISDRDLRLIGVNIALLELVKYLKENQALLKPPKM